MVILRILRHANVSTTATYYIKIAADVVRNAMTALENRIAEAGEVQEGTNATLRSEVRGRSPYHNSIIEPQSEISSKKPNYSLTGATVT